MLDMEISLVDRYRVQTFPPLFFEENIAVSYLYFYWYLCLYLLYQAFLITSSPAKNPKKKRGPSPTPPNHAPTHPPTHLLNKTGAQHDGSRRHNRPLPAPDHRLAHQHARARALCTIRKDDRGVPGRVCTQGQCAGRLCQVWK